MDSANYSFANSNRRKSMALVKSSAEKTTAKAAAKPPAKAAAKPPAKGPARQAGSHTVRPGAEPSNSMPEIHNASRASAPQRMSNDKSVVEIVERIERWAGGKAQAMAWFRSEPLPEFGGQTAEQLVNDGKAKAVHVYLDHVELGGFA